MTDRVILRVLELQFVAPSGTTTLTAINMDNPDQHNIFTSMRDKLGHHPEHMGFFKAIDRSTDQAYDMAMRFDDEVTKTMTPMDVETQYQLVTQALLKLIGILNEGGF